ncbi:MAG: 23S rRNA (adenine(2503)-C(2))-methyltransferase RlmN [Clostridiales Family XIII bacterium]|nr:23S rRNA (adenine(2503)-C(2))-methyltransferase RlmN [Clostridiales Family XIII bacterium]
MADGAKTDLWDLGLAELTEWLAALGERPFRARQIYGWMYGKGVTSFSDMSDLPAAAREKLAAAASVDGLKAAGRVCSADGHTSKMLLETGDGHFVETVFMKYKDRNSVCISTQVGCRMGCRFCASGALGLRRNLTAGEMALSVVRTEQLAGARTKNIVLMGIGEPLDNFDNVKKFIENFTDDHGRDLSRRAITLSTCGVVPGIDRLAAELPQVNLAVSLHAPNDALRARIMPVTRTWGVADVVAATVRHYERTHRRATFEYALIEGFNDGPAQAKELAGLLRGINCLVNLIPLNGAAGGVASSAKAMAEAQRFRERLGGLGIKATVRRSLGADIDAACGQLRLRHEQDAGVTSNDDRRGRRPRRPAEQGEESTP